MVDGTYLYSTTLKHDLESRKHSMVINPNNLRLSKRLSIKTPDHLTKTNIFYSPLTI